MDKTKMYIFLIENMVNLSDYLKKIKYASSKIDAINNDTAKYFKIDLDEVDISDYEEYDYEWDVMNDNGVIEGVSVSFGDNFWGPDGKEYDLDGFLYKKDGGYHGSIIYGDFGELEYEGYSKSIEELKSEILSDMTEFTPLKMEEDLMFVMDDIKDVLYELVEQDSWKPLSNLEIFGASTGSVYIQFGVENEYDEDGDLDYSETDVKLSIRDHEPSPFREKEFGSVTSYFEVDWSSPSSVESSVVWLYKKMTEYKEEEIEYQKLHKSNLGI